MPANHSTVSLPGVIKRATIQLLAARASATIPIVVCSRAITIFKITVNMFGVGASPLEVMKVQRQVVGSAATDITATAGPTSSGATTIYTLAANGVSADMPLTADGAVPAAGAVLLAYTKTSGTLPDGCVVVEYTEADA